MEKKPENTTLVLVRIDTLTPPPSCSSPGSTASPALSDAASHVRSRAQSPSTPPPSHLRSRPSFAARPRLSRTQSSPAMSSLSARAAIKSFITRHFSDALAENSKDVQELSPEELQEESIRNHTVPIKPDPPDDDEPPYTKAERKEIQWGKSCPKPPKPKLTQLFRLRMHAQEPVEEEKTMSTEVEEPPFSTTGDDSDTKPPSSQDSDEAAVTSGSEDDEDEAEGGRETAIKHEPQPPTRTFSDRTDKRPPKRAFTLIGLKKRVPRFRYSASLKTLANTSNPAKPHDDDNLDPKSARRLSSLATSPPTDPPSHHRLFSWHFPLFHPAGHASSLSARSARERLIDSPEKWLALVHESWPALFTNFADLVRYMDRPGPSDQLARLIEGVPGTDEEAGEAGEVGEASLRRDALGMLECLYLLWLNGGAGAVRDYGRTAGWRLKSELPPERTRGDGGAGRGRDRKEESVDSATEEGGGRKKRRFEGVRERVGRGVERVKGLGRRESGE